MEGEEVSEFGVGTTPQQSKENWNKIRKSFRKHRCNHKLIAAVVDMDRVQRLVTEALKREKWRRGLIMQIRWMPTMVRRVDLQQEQEMMVLWIRTEV